MTAALTTRALERWAAALPAAFYDIRLVAEEGGNALLRRFDARALAKSAGWLRHMNAAGAHGYGRPADPRHVMVDDIDEDALDALRAAHAVAAVIETSPHNHQAWVTVSAGPVEPAVAAMAARLLAARYDGDAGAASAVQVGRLPGLKNLKEIHCRADGRQPWTLLLHAHACVNPAGPALLAEAEAALARTHADMSRPVLPQRRRTALARTDATAEWQEAARRVAAQLPAGAALDRSRVDAAMARRLLARGADRDRVVAAVLAGSKAQGLLPAAARRYAERTVAAAGAAG